MPYMLVVYLFSREKIGLTDTVILFSALGLLSILSGFSLMRKFADHLVDLAKEIGVKESAGTPICVQQDADQEINDIANHFNALIERLDQTTRAMKEQSIQLMIYARDLSVSYKKAKEEEALRNRLCRYVGENVVERLMRSQDEAAFTENEKKELTVLFADIRSFTRISESLDAEEVVSMLNEFFEAAVNVIFRNHGVLDKFIGDQVMALFGPLPPLNSTPHHAVKAAVELQEATEQLMKRRKAEGKVTFEIGIGINTGIAIVGNVGSENRMDYTAIGDSVNLAARLQQLAKGGEIIIGTDTYRKTLGQFNIRKKGEIKVKNKAEPVSCYEVLRDNKQPRH